MRSYRVAVLAGTISLLLALMATLPPAARAAAAVELSLDPAVARVGQRTEVQMRTFEHSAAPDFRGRAVAFDPGFPWRVIAEAPGGRTIHVAMERSEEDSTLWVGLITFTEAGEWTIRVTNFGSNPHPTTGALTTVEVWNGSQRSLESLEESQPPSGSHSAPVGLSPAPLLLFGLVALVGLGIVGLTWHRS